ncbi:unnamed protein product [Durusdinium trenchii]|uniref:Uncharacterized protein n=1 Tax=Durusdinium trenchii TaxID=1381693 RepID=A0ABP0M4F0_9DINO
MQHLPGLVFRAADIAVAKATLQRAQRLFEEVPRQLELQQDWERTPIAKDLVLVGGGHSHVNVLRMLGMEPLPGVRVTLITRDVETPYSGMLPGHIAGLYTRRECHLDLNILARFARVRLIHGTCVGVDLEQRQVLLAEQRPPIRYDILSINIGSAPRVQEEVPRSVTPVKPIDGFGRRWARLLERLPSWTGPKSLGHRRTVLVVGGGAGGFELATLLHSFPWEELAQLGPSAATVTVGLVTRSGLLPQHTAGARALAMMVLKEKGIELYSGYEVSHAETGVLRCRDGRSLKYDECIWCTQGSPQSWVKSCGLRTDQDGFLLVDQQMRCHRTDGQPLCGDIFAGGDIASVLRPKAGVFAVMAGLVLWINLRATLRGEKLVTYWPQSSFLGLLNLGDGTCTWAPADRTEQRSIASRGVLAAKGAWLWHLKESWCTSWNDGERRRGPGLPEMPSARVDVRAAKALGDQAEVLLRKATMRCGGCGAKVGASTLTQAQVVLGAGDDAAVVDFAASASRVVSTVQTIDVSAYHALSDVEAMGAIPISALALVQIPYALEERFLTNGLRITPPLLVRRRDGSPTKRSIAERLLLKGGVFSGNRLWVAWVVLGGSENSPAGSYVLGRGAQLGARAHRVPLVIRVAVKYTLIYLTEEARRFLRRKKLRNRLTTKEKDKLKVRQQLLEKHHTRPRYVIPLLSAMTWKNKGQNSGRWSNWSGDWKTTDKSDKKKKEEPQGKGKANAGQVTILAYDGRRVVVPEEGGGNGGSSSASSSGLQEENRRLKEAFRSILGGTADDTTEEEVRGLLADDPREVLRQQQKELNKQKKALTKTEKVRAAMEEKSAKWTRWKAGYLKGLELEEQRYKEEMKELEAELKEVEKEKEKEKGGIMDLDAPESHEDGYKKSVDNELNTFRQQMKQMSSYVQMMEQRNQDLTNQMQQLITAVRDVKQGDLVRESPQAIKAPVHVRLDGEDAEVEEPEAREARSRSRSRTPGRALESELPSHLAPEAAGFLPLLQGMTEETQDQMLAILKAEPENFQNSEQVKKLIHVMTVQQCAAQVEVQEGSADSSDPIFQMGTGYEQPMIYDHGDYLPLNPSDLTSLFRYVLRDYYAADQRIDLGYIDMQPTPSQSGDDRAIHILVTLSGWVVKALLRDWDDFADMQPWWVYAADPPVSPTSLRLVPADLIMITQQQKDQYDKVYLVDILYTGLPKRVAILSQAEDQVIDLLRKMGLREVCTTGRHTCLLQSSLAPMRQWDLLDHIDEPHGTSLFLHFRAKRTDECQPERTMLLRTDGVLQPSHTGPRDDGDHEDPSSGTGFYSMMQTEISVAYVWYHEQAEVDSFATQVRRYAKGHSSRSHYWTDQLDPAEASLTEVTPAPVHLGMRRPTFILYSTAVQQRIPLLIELNSDERRWLGNARCWGTTNGQEFRYHHDIELMPGQYIQFWELTHTEDSRTTSACSDSLVESGNSPISDDEELQRGDSELGEDGSEGTIEDPDTTNLMQSWHRLHPDDGRTPGSLTRLSYCTQHRVSWLVPMRLDQARMYLVWKSSGRDPVAEHFIRQGLRLPLLSITGWMFQTHEQDFGSPFTWNFAPDTPWAQQTAQLLRGTRLIDALLYTVIPQPTEYSLQSSHPRSLQILIPAEISDQDYTIFVVEHCLKPPTVQMGIRCIMPCSVRKLFQMIQLGEWCDQRHRCVVTFQHGVCRKDFFDDDLIDAPFASKLSLNVLHIPELPCQSFAAVTHAELMARQVANLLHEAGSTNHRRAQRQAMEVLQHTVEDDASNDFTSLMQRFDPDGGSQEELNQASVTTPTEGTPVISSSDSVRFLPPGTPNFDFDWMHTIVQARRYVTEYGLGPRRPGIADQLVMLLAHSEGVTRVVVAYCPLTILRSDVAISHFERWLQEYTFCLDPSISRIFPVITELYQNLPTLIVARSLPNAMVPIVVHIRLRPPTFWVYLARSREPIVTIQRWIQAQMEIPAHAMTYNGARVDYRHRIDPVAGDVLEVRPISLEEYMNPEPSTTDSGPSLTLNSHNTWTSEPGPGGVAVQGYVTGAQTLDLDHELRPIPRQRANEPDDYDLTGLLQLTTIGAGKVTCCPAALGSDSMEDGYKLWKPEPTRSLRPPGNVVYWLGKNVEAMDNYLHLAGHDYVVDATYCPLSHENSTLPAMERSQPVKIELAQILPAPEFDNYGKNATEQQRDIQFQIQLPDFGRLIDQLFQPRIQPEIEWEHAMRFFQKHAESCEAFAYQIHRQLMNDVTCDPLRLADLRVIAMALGWATGLRDGNTTADGCSGEPVNLSTGTLFAADMRAKARGVWVAEALRRMASSNGHGANACTDVTGFGLIGHLLEMCSQSQLEATPSKERPFFVSDVVGGRRCYFCSLKKNFERRALNPKTFSKECLSEGV